MSLWHLALFVALITGLQITECNGSMSPSPLTSRTPNSSLDVATTTRSPETAPGADDSPTDTLELSIVSGSKGSSLAQSEHLRPRYLDKPDSGYTITASDFAAKTASAGIIHSDHRVTTTSDTGGNNNAKEDSKGLGTHTELKVDVSLPKDGTTQHQLIPDKAADNPDTVEHIQENSASTNKTLTELLNDMVDEIKVFSNDAIINWNQKKTQISQTAEATNVLKDYLDKISISQAANNSNCVLRDLENYKKRMEILQNVVKTCEASLARVDWNKLQEKTKRTLSEIKNIAQEDNLPVKSSFNISQHTKESRLEMEKNKKKRLLDLNIPSIKEILANLRDNALVTDEYDLKKCISDNTEKGIVVDTLTDIMRIKNNCVG